MQSRATAGKHYKWKRWLMVTTWSVLYVTSYYVLTYVTGTDRIIRVDKREHRVFVLLPAGIRKIKTTSETEAYRGYTVSPFEPIAYTIYYPMIKIDAWLGWRIHNTDATTRYPGLWREGHASDRVGKSVNR